MGLEGLRSWGGHTRSGGACGRSSEDEGEDLELHFGGWIVRGLLVCELELDDGMG